MTFSLAARCTQTGMLGAVITTSSPAVGARCVHARAGVGVVLTQHWTDPRLGPRGLALLAEGCAAADALAAVVASTPERAWRQLAMIDANGGTAHFSGASNQPELGAANGPDCVAIGNILRSESVPAAMVAAFAASSSLSFAERLLVAVEAGDAAGGEHRPLTSAALLIVRSAPFPYADLRVDAASDPLAELRRLWGIYEPHAEAVLARALHPDQASA
jgi:uncharacterized Ntn-hydrolase superfamily protein